LTSPSGVALLAFVLSSLAAGPPCFAQSAASHPMITMQDAFDCFGQARALRTLAEAARDNLELAAAAAREPRSAEQRREVAGILRGGGKSQQTALQLADALDACVADLIEPSATWPTARAAMFRIEADAVLVRAGRFDERYAQVSKSLTEVMSSDAAAEATPALLQTYGGFGPALRQKVTATREKMNALGKKAPPAPSPSPG
jgi:hypothetical protein